MFRARIKSNILKFVAVTRSSVMIPKITLPIQQITNPITVYKEGYKYWKDNDCIIQRFFRYDQYIPKFYDDICDKLWHFTGATTFVVSSCWYYCDYKQHNVGKVNMLKMLGFGTICTIPMMLISVPIILHWPVTVPACIILGTLGQIKI